MSSDRTLITTLAFLLLFTISSVFSQVAVDVEKSAKTSEERETEETPPPKAPKRAVEVKPRKSIQEQMRPEEFKAAGLDKLTEEELQHLDAWLQGYRQTAEKKATEQVQTKANEQIKKATEEANARAAQNRLDAIASRVDGKFEGLKGRTLIKLEDGSVWRQANADDRYRTPITDHPNVAVFHSTFGYKMRIEGMPEFYVDPVSRP